jgi:hypothetical protein
MRILSETSTRNAAPLWFKRLLAGTILVIAGAPACPPETGADEIYFKSGYSETGVVMRETESSVRFKTEMGLVTVSKEKVDFIDKATEEENRKWLRKWRDEELRLEEQLETRREAQRKFEADQLAKGLVKFTGEWMTPERRQEILDLRKKAKRHREEFEQEQMEKGLVQFQHIWVTPQMDDKLRDMKEEIQRLADDNENKGRMVESLRAAMLNISAIDDLEAFTDRIEEITQSIADNNRRLSRLFEKADEIEASSVRYEMPAEFEGVLPDE